MENFPYKYYFYGSEDSTDLDVLIQIDEKDMPVIQEDRKIFLKQIETKYNLKWNSNLIVIENGIVSNTIYPKSWIDSINNSLFTTYSNHLNKQVYPLPITNLVKRNKLLAIYKTVRTILSMMTRTHYRTLIKPISNGIHPFNKKIEALSVHTDAYQLEVNELREKIEKFEEIVKKQEDIVKLALGVLQELDNIEENKEIIRV